MSTKAMQPISTASLLSDGFVDTLFGLLIDKLPEGEVVAAIIMARNDGREMRVHFKSLTDDELSDEGKWWDGADVKANIYSRDADEITTAAKHRWPEVRVFVVPGCLCCNGSIDLCEYER